jgi:acetyl-CoA carboxylase biotin carboxylase subunit
MSRNLSTKVFKKLLVANRGTIAVRIIRACRELGISTVAVYSTADKAAMHVRMADESVCIGPPAAQDSYLNIQSVVSAAIAYGADAIHTGYGFLSENGDFAEACQRSGLFFVGPRARHIRLMGDKPRALRIMKRAGVPVLPGSEGNGVTDLREAQTQAKALGFPVLIKAAAGGGGKGMRIVRNLEELTRLFPLARSESEAAFGSRKMYLEKYLERARHVEFQILADNRKNVIHLGERDCSIQRRHQKVLEESPCPVLTPRLRDKMGKAAVRAAEVVGYSNVGTVEFLLTADGEFHFIEMNTRIQVEHGVTEMVTGVDLVKESLLLAMGEPLRIKQRQVHLTGAAIECRIYAEDPDLHLPSPGVVSNHHSPGGLGVRVETALYDGYRVPVHYDPLVAKLIVHAEDRPLAIARSKAALREYLIDGIKTNIPLHLKILDDPDFIAGQVATDFLVRYETREEPAAPRAPRRQQARAS